MGEELWNIDFGQIQEFLNETIELQGISFQDIVKSLLSGDISSALSAILEAAEHVFSQEIAANRSFFLQILLIALFSALFTVFASVFENSQIADVGFYVSYLLMITFLTASMTLTIQIAVEVVKNLTGFMKAFIPAFAMAITFTSGSVTAMAYYESVFLLAYGVEYALCWGIIPLIRVQVVLALVNHISREDILSRLQQLVRTVCDWSLRTMLTAVLGVQALQNLLVPYIHGTKAGIVQKAVSAIPGIGDGVQSITDMVLGGGIIIKNGIGGAALILVVLLCIVPLIKLAVIYLMFQITAAIVQPMVDMRMVNGIQCGAEACSFLIRAVFLCGLLFFITIALTCSATGRTAF